MSTTSSNKENLSMPSKHEKSSRKTGRNRHIPSKLPKRSESPSDNSEESEAESVAEENRVDSSDSDCMSPVITKKRKVGNGKSDPSIAGSDASKETIPIDSGSSSDEKSDDDDDASSTSSKGDDASPVPDTPDGQWEIEEILNFVRDDFGLLYHVKWKDWSEDFNTWEPPANLLNCEDELLRFYRKRKAELQKALDESEYVILPNGKRRRKGPSLPDVPPDPRPLEARVEEFFNITNCVLDDEIWRVFLSWKAKKINPKSRWSLDKINKYLEDGIDGKLSKSDIKALRDELILIEVEKKSKELTSQIKGWENKINAITGGRPLITIENDVDMQGPPIGFKFVNDYIPGEGVVIPKDPPVGCSCSKVSNCYDERSKCCAMQFDYKFAYTKYRKVNLQQGSPIYECNSKCKCGPDCANRVVQDGKSDHKLSIFRTSNGCGWGVKTLKSIKKGSFVTLYVGEVIKSEEAERRGKLYDEIGCTYLFDLDFNDPDNYPYSVDASKYGNVAHFINHSCAPNLGVYAVWIDCLDPNLPKLAMFALRDIAKNEELTFDYNVQLNSNADSTRTRNRTDEEEDDRPPNKKTICLCATSKCRKYIF